MILSQLQTYSKRTNLEPETEEETIEASKIDASRFEPIYNRYFKRIFLFVYRKVNDKTLTADITSQVFLKALNGIRGYSSKGLPISSWLFRIAINECNIYFRKQAASRTVVLEDHHYATLTEGLVSFGDEGMGGLHRAIRSLKEREIQLIELRFFEGMKFSEIAEILNITENNAKVRMYRVLEKLRKKLVKK